MTGSQVGAQIYSSLNRLLAFDNQIDEFAFVLNCTYLNSDPVLKPVSSPELQIPSNPQEGPALFLSTTHKLALAYWALIPLFDYANALFQSLRPSLQQKLSEFSDDQLKQLNESTRALLLINADDCSAWNARHLLHTHSHQSYFRNELCFINLLLTKHPKSGELWSARRRLLFQYLSQLSDNDWMNERLIALKAVQAYERNYYAWTHRLWVIEQQLLSENEVDLQKELNELKDYNSMHISDFSAAWVRFRVVQMLIDSYNEHSLAESIVLQQKLKAQFDCQSCELLKDELVFASDLLKAFPGHETLWLYRRFISSILFNYTVQHKHCLVQQLTEDQFSFCAQDELLFAENAMQRARESKMLTDIEAESEKRYAFRHKIYFKHQIATIVRDYSNR